MWKNWNSRTLLVGLKNGAATVEKRVVILQTVKHRITMGPRNSILRYIPKAIEKKDPNTYMHMFKAALFTTAKDGNSPNAHQWAVNRLWCVHTTDIIIQL